MDYSIKKIYNHGKKTFFYHAINNFGSFALVLALYELPRLSPNFETPEEVVDYMDKKSQECLIDPNTVKRTTN